MKKIYLIFLVFSLIFINIWNSFAGAGYDYYSSDFFKWKKVEHLIWEYTNVDNSIYLRWKKVNWGDIKTFEIIIESDYYVKDKNNVYSYDWIIKWADSKTFDLIKVWQEDGMVAKDKNFIYYKWNRLKWSDTSEFKIINDYYFIDKNYLYSTKLTKLKVEWSDPKTVKRLYNKKTNEIIIDSDYYVKDKNNVYYQWKIIKWLDYESFELINHTYWKDKNNVYYDWKKIEWIDNNSLDILNHIYTKDNNSIYCFWKKMKWVDYKTFKVIEWSYSKDKDNIYIWGKIAKFSLLSDKNKKIFLKNNLDKIDSFFNKIKNNKKVLNSILLKVEKLEKTNKNEKIKFLLTYISWKIFNININN